MLPRNSRIRTAADFAAVIKGGRRAGTKRLVVHVLASAVPVTPRAGFVVSAKVGNSVVRHRVTRRLRPLVREALRSVDPGISIVVRALPTAASATSTELGADLRSGLTSAFRKVRPSALHPAALHRSVPDPSAPHPSALVPAGPRSTSPAGLSSGGAAAGPALSSTNGGQS